jgi:hypothetical protein
MHIFAFGYFLNISVDLKNIFQENTFLYNNFAADIEPAAGYLFSIASLSARHTVR